ncbi:MAG: hypothetical protein ACR2KB_06590 [Chitinophagaceae bacterium]
MKKPGELNIQSLSNEDLIKLLQKIQEKEKIILNELRKRVNEIWQKVTQSFAIINVRCMKNVQDTLKDLLEEILIIFTRCPTV